MRTWIAAIISTAMVVSVPTLAGAASLQVSPVNLEIPASGAAATIRLRNDGPAPLNAQIRVFRWVQENGQEKLEPTNEVVASPPFATLARNADYVVRIVRTSKQPLTAGASYRLLVDELPDPQRQRNGTIAMVLRHSIPVFFYPAKNAAAKLTWSVTQRAGRVSVTARNHGGRHVRLAGLKLRAADGTAISFGNGLTGYVLGASTMGWAAANGNKKLAAGTSIAITAQTDSGPISVSSVVQSVR